MAELKITKDDVVAKLKDDGDFDRLRLNIIRKLKDDEELRENLRTIVRQSSAINRPGAENMKPRQLSDAIYQEVGGKLTAQISDGLWGIIRPSDGVKSEIVETVQSVYNRLIVTDGVSSRTNGVLPKGTEGFSLKREIEDSQQPSILLDKPDAGGEDKRSGECSDDEDPDVPPGFG